MISWYGTTPQNLLCLWCFSWYDVSLIWAQMCVCFSVFVISFHEHGATVIIFDSQELWVFLHTSWHVTSLPMTEGNVKETRTSRPPLTHQHTRAHTHACMHILHSGPSRLSGLKLSRESKTAWMWHWLVIATISQQPSFQTTTHGDAFYN